MVMVWRLPLLRKTLKSLEFSNQRPSSDMSVSEESRKRLEIVKHLARKRLDRANTLSLEDDIPRHFG